MPAIGYGAAAIGGGSASATLVTNLNDSGAGSLRAALAGDSPKVVRITATGTLNALTDIPVGSNTTLIGNQSFFLSGRGLAAETKENIIIRAMKIRAVAEDCLRFWQGCTDFWIDDCDLINAGDELIDISHASTDWTISYTRFHHLGSGIGYAILVGSSNDHTGDSVIRGTIHNNAFVGCVGRQPHLRFGKIHAFNNVVQGWTERAVTAIYGAEYRSEGNIYRASGANLNSAIVTAPFPPFSTVGGSARSIGDLLLDGAGFNGTDGNDTVFTPPYAYTVVPATLALESQVLAQAGTGANPPAPSNVSPPTIVGTIRPGQRVTSTVGVWTDDPSTFVRQWQVSQTASDAGPWADIPLEDEEGYGIDFEFTGRCLRLKVAASNGGASGVAYSAPTAVIVDDDPVFAGSPTAWSNPGTTGTTIDLAGGRRTVTGTVYVPANTTVNGPGEIIFSADSAILSITSGTVFNDVTFTGTLSDLRQFTLLHDGLVAQFAAPTFVDVGSGMTSAVISGRLEIDLAGGTQRQVVSSLIALDSSKKYAVRTMPGFAAGSGHMSMVVERCNAGGAELGEFNPQDVGVWLSITNTEAIKIKLGALRQSGAPTGQVAEYDLTKILIYEVINDLAALVGGSPHQNVSHMYIGGTGPTFNDCRWRRHKFAPAKVIDGSGARFNRPIVRSSLGCISSQGGTDTVITDLNSDIRATDQHGNLVPTGIAARNHNVLYSGNPAQGPEEASSVVRGVVTGASWAFECPENGNVSIGIVVDRLKLTAEHCGISNCATNGQSKDCKLTLHPLGYMGIEIPTANGASVLRNHIWQDSVARQAHGIAGSNGNINAVIEDNWIHSGVGIQLTNPANTCVDRGISVKRNTIYYSVNAVAYNVGGINFENNSGGRVSYHAMRGGGAPSPYQVWGCTLETNTGNDIEGNVTAPSMALNFSDTETPPEQQPMTATVTTANIDIAAIMTAAQAQAVGAQKSKYLTDLIAAIGSGASVHLLRNGTEVYRDNVTGSLTQSGGNLVLPNVLAEPPEVNTAADVDSGTWTMEVRNAASPAVKLIIPVGNAWAQNALRFDQDTDGLRAVRLSNVTFAAPSTLDVGAPGGGGGTLTAASAVERVISSMQGLNERPLRGITELGNSAPNWAKPAEFMNGQSHASVVGGARPRYVNLTQWYKDFLDNYHSDAANLNWGRYVGWGVVIEGGTMADGAGVGHRSVNTGVRCYPQRLWGLLPSGQWELVANAQMGSTGGVPMHLKPSYGEEVQPRTPSRQGPGGSIEFYVPPESGLVDRGPHPYLNSYVSINPDRYIGCFAVGVVQLIRWDPNGVDDRNLADLVYQTGGDWYTEPREQYRAPWWPNMFLSRCLSITSDPQWFGAATLSTARVDNLNPQAVITVTQLRNNPPPIGDWTP